MVRAKKETDSSTAVMDSDDITSGLGPDGVDLAFTVDDVAHSVKQASSGAVPSSGANPDAPVEPVAVMNAFNEIQAEADAAKHALAHVKTTDLPESVAIPEMEKSGGSTAFTEEQAEQLYEKKRLRALKERERGLARLTTAPTRAGEMVLTRQVSIGDVALANMAQRFVYIADRLLSRLHGYGAMIMGEAKAATAVEILSAQIDELHREAKMLFDQSKQALSLHRARVEESNEEWFEFQVTNVAMSVEVHLLRREGNKFLESIVLYDKAIAEIRRLESNYGTETDQVEYHIAKARKDAYKIYRSALSGQIELGRILAGRRAKKGGPTGNANAAPEATTQSAEAGALVEA